MFQVRIHGRGGQGVVAAAEILSMAAFAEGRHAQAFPSFGSERMGAPVVSFCRIDDRPIRTHEPVMEPDALVIQDVTLIHQVELFAGLSADAYVLINTSRSFDELGLGGSERRHPRDLSSGERKWLHRRVCEKFLPPQILKRKKRGFAVITLDAIGTAVRERFPGAVGDRNMAAAAAAFRFVTLEEEEMVHASTD